MLPRVTQQAAPPYVRGWALQIRVRYASCILWCMLSVIISHMSQRGNGHIS